MRGLVIFCAAIALTGCGPSKQQTECEEREGDWRSKTELQYVFIPAKAKYEHALVTYYYCDL